MVKQKEDEFGCPGRAKKDISQTAPLNKGLIFFYKWCVSGCAF